MRTTVDEDRMRARGFTLIELMVVLLIAAVIAVIALPSIRNPVRDQQTEALASRFQQDLAWLRGQAVSGATTATLTIGAGCTWTVATGGGNNDVAHSMTAATLAATAPGTTCNATMTSISFDPLGMATIAPGTLASQTIAFIPTTGSSVTLQIFDSGAIVSNPANAS